MVEGREPARPASRTDFLRRLANLAGLWETCCMPKRKLRIVKRVRNVPVLGICELCNEQFTGNPNMGNAQSAIQEHFNAHTCKPQVASPNPIPIVKETTKK